MMPFAIGDEVCVDITVAKQLPVDGYEVLITDDIPDIWLPGVVVTIVRDGRYEVDLLGPEEGGPARFLVAAGGIRRRASDGTCA
jgi:hypothetical protein